MVKVEILKVTGGKKWILKVKKLKWGNFQKFNDKIINNNKILKNNI